MENGCIIGVWEAKNLPPSRKLKSLQGKITGHDKKGEIFTFTPYEVTKRGISFKKTVKISVNDTINKTDKQ